MVAYKYPCWVEIASDFVGLSYGKWSSQDASLSCETCPGTLGKLPTWKSQT